MTTTQTQAKHETVQKENQYIAQTYVRPNFVLSHGDGMTLWDTDGNAYTDFVAGIAVMALGHSNPEITRIIQDTAGQLVQVSNLYYTQPQADLAESLCENSFADKVFFCNSGAEANEACIKFARKVAYSNGNFDKTEIIAFSHGFHGRTMGALALTPKSKYQDPFRPLMPEVTILPFNDIAAAQNAIGPNTCAVFVEPVQGEGGINPASNEFLQALRVACDHHEALLVFDEVQCGLGRTGTLWAHEPSGVTPDLMALAKPLASGLPIGAALMTEKVHVSLEPGDHGSTFAGGNLVTSVAQSVFNQINTPQMRAHVQEMGEYFHDRLVELNAPQIKDVRGRGLMLGMELTIPATDVVNAGFDAGFLLVNAGPDVVRFVPPLIVQKEHIDALINFLSDFFIN
jgi:predicted acetylornithine/succinylornithine family transaminase